MWQKSNCASWEQGDGPDGTANVGTIQDCG